MITRFSEAIVTFLDSRGAVDKTQYDVYVYGMGLALYALMSTAGLIIIGTVCDRLLDSLLLIAVFYVNQTVGGGYHANSHVECFFVMLGGLIISIYVNQWHHSFAIIIISFALAMVTLVAIPLVLHPNKRYLYSIRKKLAKRSRLVSIIMSVFILGTYVLGMEIADALRIGLIVSAISRLYGWWLYNMCSKHPPYNRD